MVADIDGRWLRAQRRARGWDVPEMARQLARAAGDTRGSPPHHHRPGRYVRRWESGSVRVSERYKILYARALGIPGGELPDGRATGDRPAGPYAPEIISVLVRALQAPARDAPAGRDLAEVQHDVVRAWRLRQSAQYAELGTLIAGLLLDAVAHLEASRVGEIG